MTNLKDTRAQAKTSRGDQDRNRALSAEIDELEQSVKSHAGSSNSKKRQYLLASQNPPVAPITQPKAEPDEQYLTSASQPETVLEEPGLEGSDCDEPLLVEESDNLLDERLREREARLKQLEDFEEIKHDEPSEHRFGSVSLLGESILENEKIEDYNWSFEQVADLPIGSGIHIVSADSISHRCFVLLSNL